MRSGLVFALGLPAFSAALALAGSPVDAATDGVQLEVGQRAPTFVLPLMNAEQQASRRFRLEDFLGPRASAEGRSVVLSFGASYCGPCRAELTELKQRASEFERRRATLAVVVIDTDKAGIDAMRRLTIDELRLPFAVLADRFGVLARRYGATNLPMTVLIDGAGRVRFVHAGYEPGSVDRLITEVGRLTAPAVAASPGGGGARPPSTRRVRQGAATR